MSGSRGRPEVSVSIKVRYESIAKAKAVLEATSPDNLKAPQDTMIKSRLSGTEIQFDLRSAKGIGSLISTVDDLLSCMQAAERAIRGVG